MKSACLSLVLVSLLLMSVDGAADIAAKGHPHGSDDIHQNTTLLVDDASVDTQTDNLGDHCERCCHGHFASAVAQISAVATPSFVIDHPKGCALGIRKLNQAPPTPPPNV